MVRYLPIGKLVLILGLMALLVLLLVSGCDEVSDLLGGRGQGRPTAFALVAPDESTVLVQSPVQVQTTIPDVDVSRVELRVKGPADESPRLIRSDVPVNGYLIQEWRPLEPVTYTIQVLPYDSQGNLLAENLTRQIRAISPAVALQELEPVIPRDDLVGILPPAPSAGEVVPIIEPTEVVATPTAVITGDGEITTTDAEISVASVEVLITPTPTPMLYPPPPAAPGVPPGPVDSDPDYGPPACDAAAYEGVYTGDTSRRVLITEPDQEPARSVGGSMVFRAWRLRNIGLCTWGPGYELAFYGGRSMGSGGVAFESTFPSEPARRNLALEANRLVVPEARPNQVAVLEVLLNVPATPGIHQSYWRMRNPAGIYFGPIIGVTLDVVRECGFGIYGAPVINRFEIIGVGDVYRPENPTSVLGEVGQPVTLRYDIINAQNFDIVIEGPTGDIESTSTTDPSNDVILVPDTVGRYTLTLFADNGVCPAQAKVYVEVLPATEQQFTLSIALPANSLCAGSNAQNVEFSSAVAPGNVVATWRHFDPAVTQASLLGQGLRLVEDERCLFGWSGLCWDVSEWQTVGSPVELLLREGEEAEAGRATIRNIEQRLLNTACSAGTACGIRYVALAEKDGARATPYQSNLIDVSCGSSTVSPRLPTEIIEGGAAGFNPQ